MLISFLQKNIFFRNIIYQLGKMRANSMVGEIKSFLKKEDRILDIGAGACNVCEILLRDGYKITPLDIQDLSFVNNIKPIIYNGNKIPFNDNEFDVALILTVLHHTSHPEKVIEEAKRVSKRIIIVEDIYTNKFRKYLIYFFDSLLNLEFIGHPHSNKNDKQWREICEKLGLKLIDAKYSRSLLVFDHATYYFER